MKIADLGITPERVREIAAMSFDDFGRCDPVLALNTAAPEFARAALEWAAKQCADKGKFLSDGLSGRASIMAAAHFDDAEMLRQLAKEIEP